MSRKHPLPQPGDTFERLTILEAIPAPQRWIGKPQATYRWYRCQCVCGTIKELSENTWNSRNTRSCGCLQRDKARIIGASKRTHHENTETSKEYRAWCHMKSRCLNKNVERYPHYGGRGIVVCQQWLDSYETFLADVGRAPTPQHSLGREDNNGPYAPDNVRWETMKEQGLNSRHNRRIPFQNENLTIGEWAKRTGLNRRTIQSRLDNYGYTIAEALTLPLWHTRSL